MFSFNVVFFLNGRIERFRLSWASQQPPYLINLADRGIILELLAFNEEHNAWFYEETDDQEKINSATFTGEAEFG